MKQLKQDQKTVVIVGDIHGDYEKLLALLNKLEFTAGTHILVCTGDLIDRGLYNEEVLELFIENQHVLHSVLGNHDSWLARILDFETREEFIKGDQRLLQVWLANGGRWILRHLETDEGFKTLKRYSQWVATIPKAIEIELDSGCKIGVIHGEVHQDDWDMAVTRLKANCPSATNSALWARNKLRYEDWSEILGVKHIFSGHSVVPQVTTLGNQTYIDTGSVFDSEPEFGRLTAIVIKPNTQVSDFEEVSISGRDL